MSHFYPGKRLSTKGHRCTVRYVGEVEDKQGEWLGVEWDDPSRGKHSGSYGGVEYFKCRSPQPAAGSFLRPSSAWDQPRNFLGALRSKYAATEAEIKDGQPVIRISGKEAEEVGFDKVARQQAQLQNLKIVVLDGLLIQSSSEEISRRNSVVNVVKSESIEETCPNVTELDLGRNLFESIEEIASICAELDILLSLKLNGNRLRDVSAETQDPLSPLADLAKITTLSLDDMLLQVQELDSILRNFAMLKELSASSNIFKSLDSCRFPSSLQSVVLEDNDFVSLEDAVRVSECCPQLRALNLKNNQIETAFRSDQGLQGASQSDSRSLLAMSSSLYELDLTYNRIRSWQIIDNLPQVFPRLKHLRISHNPLFENLQAADGKALTSADGYMLTIARLPNLETLNYSTVTDKERLNAESYYLSQIAAELSLSPTEKEAQIISKHPRYRALCDEYGEPRIERQADNKVDPNSLAARLVKCSFYCSGIQGSNRIPTRTSPYVVELPKSLSIYSVLGIVGKHLSLPPMQLRLILETGEKDRVGQSSNDWQGVQEWDSDEEDMDGLGDEWREREVDLVAGTRPLGTVAEHAEALIRVELKPSLASAGTST
ncbi:hypothetical protein MBLNU459_g6966t1 [Dothideomycetes sp. NU459]